MRRPDVRPIRAQCTTIPSVGSGGVVENVVVAQDIAFGARCERQRLLVRILFGAGCAISKSSRKSGRRPAGRIHWPSSSLGLDR